MEAGLFSLEMQVRDYELDMQGIVNNSVYQNYLEHARHEYLKSLAIDFASLSREGLNLVVIRAELDYRASLTSGDSFRVTVRMERLSRLKFAFLQEIIRQADGKPIMAARIIGTALNARGRPEIPAQLDSIVPLPE
ncbi:MAG: hypothetical protein A2087_07305 [Spirochaetes bacterium GWD1_61_31]|nr:MAG: hypothetical protein A2Y37_08170 [Spirochaetes bacterium GWB1_60_80]OHD34219.1 MAG: hypothetical protein A2004_12575 [Spirochaetes bacterium GWC1_61_12]OHD40147.1 MAG: hypothetical protein A2087_07305 [Spirochaetes bacterium GWD1_61_31]OHD45805.1 MAG: hypothetical protein A2Y35_03805 [Spirochaetes bacterium GWE1_60_18]OHD58347.1 MAG: hypothetical protein A2Y32_06195 [Spirochaetes bacterium GWF1_60_12]HAW86346.1 thioesterase [Spirochaetaceae bacterium]